MSLHIFGIGKPRVICANCGQIGKTRINTPGSGVLEILLWVLFLLPGMIYTAWRLNKRRELCRACGSADVIPLSTPRGKLLSTQFQVIPSGNKPSTSFHPS
jgi:hypothetical protein